MLPITGYVDRWSVKPGEPIRFMIGVQGGGRFRARIARVICGDPNPAGPGYRELPVPWDGEGEHEGEEQPIHLGSFVDIPNLDLPTAPGPLGLRATVWPTRLAAGRQAVLSWSGNGQTITLGLGPAGAFCRLTTSSGAVEAETAVPLTERAWHDLSATLDPATGQLSVHQAPHRPRLDRNETAEAATPLPSGPGPAGKGTASIAAERAGREATQHFNGKVERPQILAGAKLLADWDLAGAMETDGVPDAGQGCFHGRCVNLPTRAMTGSNWRGNVHRWTEDPSQYGAIHFHDDDLGDAGWRPAIAFTVPQDWVSGVYALHLEHASGARDNIVFYVRATVPGQKARVAFLAPTFTYTVYGQFQKSGRQALITPRSLQWGALPQAPDGHPEYGVSPYNFHADGSGVVMSTMRRPMIDKRVNQIHLVDPSPGGSGLYWMAADSYVTGLLDHEGIDVEVITDHDVHAEGVELLSSYAVVLTGQHPEYHTGQTLDALAAFLERGGRFMYLGGNGFYWKVVPHGESPWSFELRRAEGGIRIWAALPGEGYHAHDGSYGGLWRRLGRPPQQLVGVGFSTQGEYKGYPYAFLDGILDPRVAFMRLGMENAMRPGNPLGERGLMGGGAAGHELDRADTSLGTPHHAIIVGRAVLHDPTYQPVNEERLDHTWPGPRDAIIRSDLTFFETPNGGAVFSAGSMNFIGALPIDGYNNVAARLVANIVRRFADPAPFEIANPTPANPTRANPTRADPTRANPTRA